MGNININFPFRDSDNGYYLDLTSTDKEAIKADLMHLILTERGKRFYMPDFGTNLVQFIFEPNDSITYEDISQEITDVVGKYLPKLKINKVDIQATEDIVHGATVRIDYTITEDVFSSKDFVLIKL